MAGKYSLLEAFEMLARTRSAATSFSSRPIASPIRKKLLELTQLAPTSFNLQPYKFLLVSSEDSKQVLSSSMLGGNGRKVQEAPLSVVFLSYREPHRLTQALMDLELSRGSDPAYVQTLPAKLNFLLGPGWLAHKIRSLSSHLASPLTPTPVIPYGTQWAAKNTMFAAQQLLLAATALQLSSAPMEGFDERRICYNFGVPIEKYSIPLVVSLGYAEGVEIEEVELSTTNSLPSNKARYPLADICYEDRYGQAAHL